MVESVVRGMIEEEKEKDGSWRIGNFLESTYTRTRVLKLGDSIPDNYTCWISYRVQCNIVLYFIELLLFKWPRGWDVTHLSIASTYVYRHALVARPEDQDLIERIYVYTRVTIEQSFLYDKMHSLHPLCILTPETHYRENSGYRRFSDLLYSAGDDSLLTCSLWIASICNCSTSSDSYFAMYMRLWMHVHLDTGVPI